jgi:hypothetical protein
LRIDNGADPDVHSLKLGVADGVGHATVLVSYGVNPES